MLAENIENLLKKERLEERQKGLQEGRQEGLQEGEQRGVTKTALNLIKLGVLSDEQIAEATGLTVADVKALRVGDKH